MARTVVESKANGMKVSAEYPDGSTRPVDARERRIPLMREGAITGEILRVREPIETEDWTFVFQVDADAPGGGIYRAIPLLDADTFAWR